MPRIGHVLLVVAVLTLHRDGPSVARCCEPDQCVSPEVSHSRKGGVWWASTENFDVCSFRNADEAEQIAIHCEKLRFDLIDLYEFENGKAKWRPKCAIYLYPHKSKYGAIVGRAAQESLGSSLVTPATGQIESRRIDLRTDVPDFRNEVLPHELTHVLISDHFRSGPPPLWYDEGLALLADSQTKQALHGRDLRHGLERGRSFPLLTLLNTSQYPSPDKLSVFYGQCASVAHYLSTHAGTRKIHEFARLSQQVGVNRALESAYGLQGISELERMWRDSLSRSPQIIRAQYSRDRDSH